MYKMCDQRTDRFAQASTIYGTKLAGSETVATAKRVNSPHTLLNPGLKVRPWKKLQAAHGAQRHFIGKKGFLWERLSASIVAAGKPLPQKMSQLT
jgi:hypothetical protein